MIIQNIKIPDFDKSIHIPALPDGANAGYTLCGVIIDMYVVKTTSIKANCENCIREVKFAVLVARDNVQSGL